MIKKNNAFQRAKILGNFSLIFREISCFRFLFSPFVFERKKFFKKSKKMFTKDVATKLEKREVWIGKDHIQKVKKSFFLFSICKETQVEKRKRDEGDLALTHGKINHKTSTEVTKRKTFLVHVGNTSLYIAQSGRTEANEMLIQQCNSRSKECPLQHSEACIKQGDVHSQKNGKNRTLGNNELKDITEEQNVQEDTHNRRRALSDRVLGG